MDAIVEKKEKIIYDVYDYSSKYDSFDTLKEARECFRKIKKDYGQGMIVKRSYEFIEIKTEVVLQKA